MDTERFKKGFVWGVAATVAMSVVMVIGMATGVAPMPKPIPVAIAATVLGAGLAKPALMAAGIVSHLLYGGVWGGMLAALVRPVTVWSGLALGAALWLLMQVAWLPFIGWGVFGTAVTPMIAGATLVLHLVYGAAAGWWIGRALESERTGTPAPAV